MSEEFEQWYDDHTSCYRGENPEKDDCKSAWNYQQVKLDNLNKAIKDLTTHISSQNDEIEKMCDVAKETITTLEHARTFITSKWISMHPAGIDLYDENIEALRKIAYR